MSTRRELPDNWEWTTVGEISFSIQYGYTASAINRANGPRFLRITDIQDGEVRWNEVPSCDITDDEIEKYRLENGDLVFARTGATTGKSYLIQGCPEAVFASYLIRLRAVSVVNPAYVYAFFQSSQYWLQIGAGKRGIGQPNVNSQILGSITIPLAPAAEQRRIVAEIEKQFARLDECTAALRRVAENLKQYRASVLKAACEGRLVPTEAELARAEGRDYEPASVLLERILAERRARWEADQLARMKAQGKAPKDNKWKAKYEEPEEPEAGYYRPELPEGWTWSGFEQLASHEKYAIKAGPFGSALKKSFYVQSGYKIYGQEQVISGDPFYGDYYISEDHYRELISCAVKPGDMLISLVGTSGKILILPEGIEPGIINPRLLKLTLNQNAVNAQYAKIYLESLESGHIR